MAILRSKEIWDMEVDEIQDKLVELRTELSKNVSKNAAAGVVENPGKIIDSQSINLRRFYIDF